MAQQVEFGKASIGKLRGFWPGLGFSIITLGIYYYFWYYFVNDELRDIGTEFEDQSLAQSSPGLSVLAVLVGGVIIIPPLLSVYNYGNRIRRAQHLTGIPREKRIKPLLAFLLVFPFGVFVIPHFIHYWYVTKHQNIALRAASGLPHGGEPVKIATPV